MFLNFSVTLAISAQLQINLSAWMEDIAKGFKHPPIGVNTNDKKNYSKQDYFQVCECLSSQDSTVLGAITYNFPWPLGDMISILNDGIFYNSVMQKKLRMK